MQSITTPLKSSDIIVLSNRNVLNVDEPSQLITVETSLRMTWTDPRLNVTIPDGSPSEYIRFGPDVMKYIWVPDVFIDGIKDLRAPAYKVLSNVGQKVFC